MTTLLRTTLLALLLCPLVGRADEPIRMPSGTKTVVVTPPEPTDADAPIRITRQTLYVFDSDIPVIVLTSPPGRLMVAEEKGPLRVLGKFADDPSKYQTRTYSGKFVYTAAPTGNGSAEILVVPVGSESSDKVVRRVVTAVVGDEDPKIAPVDPVKPVDPPPKEEPKYEDGEGPTTLGDGFRILILVESADLLPSAQQIILYGKNSRELMDSVCTKEGTNKAWRIWDKDVKGLENELPVWSKAMELAKTQKTPAVVISNGKTMFVGPLPKNVTDFSAKIKRYKDREGK